jgi:hypothetical protein
MRFNGAIALLDGIKRQDAKDAKVGREEAKRFTGREELGSDKGQGNPPLN